MVVRLLLESLFLNEGPNEVEVVGYPDRIPDEEFDHPSEGVLRDDEEPVEDFRSVFLDLVPLDERGQSLRVLVERGEDRICQMVDVRLFYHTDSVLFLVVLRPEVHRR